MNSREHSHLPRLEFENYQGLAVVHWNLSSKGRAKGWLTIEFYYRFRELLLHGCVRQSLVCPVFCLMPDHIHFVWMGFSVDSDQRLAMKFFRTQINKELRDFEFDHQAYDHVLKQEERQQNAFARMCSYILNNPVRAELVGDVVHWKFSGAIIPGYPDMNPWERDYWPLFWRVYYKLRDGKKEGA